jgi:hypothetical protein
MVLTFRELVPTLQLLMGLLGLSHLPSEKNFQRMISVMRQAKNL